MKSNILSLTILAMGAFSFTACDDITQVDEVLQNEKIETTGAPVITRVVLANDVDDTPIEEAAFTQVVRIEGKNLGGATSVRFNDIEVDLAELYSSYNAVLARVPRQLPVNVTDKVYVTNRFGETSAPLRVTVPQLNIKGLYCEYAQPGDTTYIEGND